MDRGCLYGINPLYSVLDVAMRRHSAVAAAVEELHTRTGVLYHTSSLVDDD